MARAYARRSPEAIEQAEYKYCKACDDTKPLSDFSKNCKSPDGHQYKCKSCMSAYDREYKYG